MSLRPKTILYYVIIFGFTAFLIWISLRGLKVTEGTDKWAYLKTTWQSADKRWLLAMAGIALLSHLVRAERWRMLMEPAGYHPKLSHSFYSLMVGYFVNLAIPRGGEVSRCYNLYKLDGTPADMSFGTVVVERIADLICLVLLISLCFLIESEKLFSFLNTLPFGIESGESKLFALGVVVISIVLFVFFFRWLMRKNQKFREMMQRAWTGFSSGFGTVFKLKNKGLFIFYSLLIWFLYFLTSYTVLQAFSSTSELGVSAVLSLFAIGSIAMAAPLPGGTGSYHVLVPQGLAFLYHVPLADAVAFTFIFHGWQTAIMILGGAISLLITSYKVRRNALKLEQH